MGRAQGCERQAARGRARLGRHALAGAGAKETATPSSTWRNGIDPVAEKRAAKEAASTAAKRKTFAEAAEAVIEKNRSGWKVSLEGRCSTLDQWRRDLAVTCKPIARKFVDEITIVDVKAVIQPYWEREQLDSARSLQKRIEAIFDYATAHGWRSGDNPASWNIFKHLWPLAPKGDVHHAALPWRDAPEFLPRLRQSDATSARLLEFILLTAVRSNEARGAIWAEIDLEARVWTIPAARMKMSRDHDVPLSDQAVALLQPDGGRDEPTATSSSSAAAAPRRRRRASRCATRPCGRCCSG